MAAVEPPQAPGAVSIPDDQVEGQEASESDAQVLEGRQQQQWQGQEASESDAQVFKGRQQQQQQQQWRQQQQQQWQGQEASESDGEASGRQQAPH